MTIIDLLENESSARVSYGDRWLVVSRDSDGLCFIVYQQKHRQKHARVLVNTENQDEACRYLIQEKD